jgi:hypothetical protein
MLAGVAPIPASSGQVSRMRLNRGGNRQLNRAFYTIAIVQAVHHPAARAFLARKAADHKSGREAIRALKRQLVRPVFRLLLEGAATLSAAVGIERPGPADCPGRALSSGSRESC